MKHAFLFAAVLALTGCATKSDVWVNAGATPAQAAKALQSCQAQARLDVARYLPQTPAPRVRVGVSGRFCSGPICVGVSGPAANSRAERARVAQVLAVSQCMTKAGYRPQTTQICRPGMARTLATRHPVLTTDHCVANGVLYVKGGS